MAKPKGEGEVTRVLRRVAQTLGDGKFEEALRDLLHLSEKYPDAGEIRPQIAEVYIRRGESRAKKGKLKEAQDDFERSLTWSRKPGAMVALARSLIAEGRYEDADRTLNAALETDDAYGPTHEAMGDLFMKWNEPKEAARAYEQALGLGHAAPALYRSVWEAYLRIERFDRAHDLILEGVERFPESDLLQAAAGDSFVYAKGDSDEARPYWEKAVELNPKNFGALFSLAAHGASRGERETALEFFRRAAALDLERARRLWREDMASPFRKFGDVARDQEFRRVLGWEND
jgi:tetratricopeptide (TPR) repeat protein